MGLFSKLFGEKVKSNNPDNSRLLQLIEIYRKYRGKGDSYKNVVLELMNGNSFLMFPTKNEFNTDPDTWTTLQRNSVLKLASVVNVDGLKVLGAFTDEKAMLAWTKAPTEYTAMRSKDVLDFCQENGIERIVINSDQPNMFVLERSRQNVTELQIKKDTEVQVGTPNKPLSNTAIEKLIANFKKNNTILEVYQYGQTKEGEFSIFLGFRLAINSENAKKAAVNAVQNALQSETFEQPLDLFFIETEDWYETIRRIEKSLIYKS